MLARRRSVLSPAGVAAQQAAVGGVQLVAPATPVQPPKPFKSAFGWSAGGGFEWGVGGYQWEAALAPIRMDMQRKPAHMHTTHHAHDANPRTLHTPHTRHEPTRKRRENGLWLVLVCQPKGVQGTGVGTGGGWPVTGV